jgi:hypothetical protein
MLLGCEWAEPGTARIDAVREIVRVVDGAGAGIVPACVGNIGASVVDSAVGFDGCGIGANALGPAAGLAGALTVGGAGRLKGGGATMPGTGGVGVNWIGPCCWTCASAGPVISTANKGRDKP